MTLIEGKNNRFSIFNTLKSVIIRHAELQPLLLVSDRRARTASKHKTEIHLLERAAGVVQEKVHVCQKPVLSLDRRRGYRFKIIVILRGKTVCLAGA